MERSNLVFSGVRMTATAQSLCSILKSSPVQHLASLVCFQLQSIAGLQRSGSCLEPECRVCVAISHTAAKAIQLWREDIGTKGQVWVPEQERARASLFSWVYVSWAWKRPEAFSKEPIDFPSFSGFWMFPHPLVRLTGLFGQAPPPAPPNSPVPE